MLAGQFSGLLHAALVRHVVCAEHGELTHADASADAPAHDDRAATDTRAQLQSSHAHGHGHEHCTHDATPLAARSTVANALGACVDDVLPAIAAPNVRDIALPQVALLLVAPKSSPPA